MWQWATARWLLTSRMAPRAAAVTLGQMEEKTVLQTCLMCRLCWESRDSKMSTITSTHSGSASSCSAAAHNQEKHRKHLHLKKHFFLSISKVSWFSRKPFGFFFFLDFFSWALSMQLCRSFKTSSSSSGAFMGKEANSLQRQFFFNFSFLQCRSYYLPLLPPSPWRGACRPTGRAAGTQCSLPSHLFWISSSGSLQNPSYWERTKGYWSCSMVCQHVVIVSCAGGHPHLSQACLCSALKGWQLSTCFGWLRSTWANCTRWSIHMVPSAVTPCGFLWPVAGAESEAAPSAMCSATGRWCMDMRSLSGGQRQWDTQACFFMFRSWTIKYSAMVIFSFLPLGTQEQWFFTWPETEGSVPYPSYTPSVNLAK